MAESSTMEAVQEVKESAAVDLGALLDAGDGAIVALVARETELVAHRAVLAGGSPVFEAMFRHETLEASSGRVSIPDVEGPVLRQLLAYCYRLRAPQLPSMAAALLVAADKYGVAGLKADCEQQLTAQLTVETAAATAVLAVRHCCPSLLAASVAFIKANSQVLATPGWADAVLSQPRDVVEVSRLLSEPQTETSSPAAAEGGPSHGTHCQLPASAAAHHSPPLDDAVVSQLRSLSADEKGRRLIQAVEEGTVEGLRSLLAAGANVGARDESGNTALHWAAWYGHEEVARRLLEAGAEVPARNNFRNTPLHWAAWYGHAPLVRLLAASSADPNARNHNGTTPLHLAAEHGRPEVATALLEAGADRNVTNNRGKTPLDIARQYNRQQLIGMLT